MAPCGFCPPWGVFFWWLCLVFVLWCSGLPGASAGPGLSPFLFVVVIGVSFLGLWGFCSPWGVRLLSWRGCVGVCLLALWGFCSALLRFSSSWWLPLAWVLRLLVAGAWRSEASAWPGCLCSFCWLKLVFAFFPFWSFCPPWGVRLLPEWPWFVVGVCLLALWGFCSPWGVRLLPLDGCVGARGEVSFCFLFWQFCPVSLFFLVTVVGNCPLLPVAAVGVSLLVPWASARGCVWFGV